MLLNESDFTFTPIEQHRPGESSTAYNTCGHLCRYCYANADRNVVLRNMNLHDPESPFRA